MKICIFGADGRTGREVVEEVLAQNHEAVAFSYKKPSKEVFSSESVITKIGDIKKFRDVQDAISSCDAVISVIGHVKDSDPLMQTKGIRNIIQAMKESGLRRVVSLTGTGVRFEGDTPSFFDKIGNIIIKLIDKERIVDGIKHADALRDSDLNWTILRVLKLSQGDYVNNDYYLTEHGPAENITSRKKVAQILVDLVVSEDYVKKAPVVSKK